MIKAILFDADGVSLIKQEFFSDRYAREYNVPVEKIIPFFRDEFKMCQLGKADLKEELEKYLSVWGWKKSTDDFLRYWFAENTIPSEPVLDSIQELRKGGGACYLVTDNEKYRAEYILKELKFNQKFDGFFFSHEIGHSKTTPEFFNVVLEKLDLKPEEIMIFDDDEEDLRAAEQLGIRTKLCKNVEDIERSI